MCVCVMVEGRRELAPIRLCRSSAPVVKESILAPSHSGGWTRFPRHRTYCATFRSWPRARHRVGDCSPSPATGCASAEPVLFPVGAFAVPATSITSPRHRSFCTAPSVSFHAGHDLKALVSPRRLALLLWPSSRVDDSFRSRFSCQIPTRGFRRPRRVMALVLRNHQTLRSSRLPRLRLRALDRRTEPAR